MRFRRRLRGLRRALLLAALGAALFRAGACSAPPRRSPSAAPVASAKGGKARPSSAAPPSPASSLRLCSWNVRKLGHGKEKSYARVARILEASCDLAALQEVMEKRGAPIGYDALLTALGDGWVGLVTDSPRPNTGDSQAERYAVVFRPQKVRVCPGFPALRYVPDDDGRGESGSPDRFYREPAFGCFVAGATDFVLGTYHARWNKGNRDAIAEEVAGVEGAMRAMAEARPGEGDVWLVGDTNLVPSDLAKVFPRERRARGKGSTLDEKGQITSHLYDQLLVWDGRASQELGAAAEVLDVRSLGGEAESFVREVSDHLPIRVLVTTERDDD